jgi:hypothetical protein
MGSNITSQQMDRHAWSLHTSPPPDLIAPKFLRAQCAVNSAPLCSPVSFASSRRRLHPTHAGCEPEILSACARQEVAGVMAQNLMGSALRVPREQPMVA